MSAFTAPRYWALWLAFGAMVAVAHTPYGFQMRLGRLFGALAFRVMRSRRRIAMRNIALSFPALADREVVELARAHFANLGMSIVEMGMAYHAPQRLAGRIRVSGLEHLTAALARGEHVILLTAHFGALEVSGVAFREAGVTLDAVFRRNRNPLLDEYIRRGRERAARNTIEKRDIKRVVRSLREGVPVWYAPDQSYDRKQSDMVTFFAEPAMMTTATTSLARLGDARIVAFFPFRDADSGTYEVRFSPPMESVPSDDPAADTVQINAMIEDAIRRAPAQYYWVHRKFKHRPAALPDAYADLRAEDARLRSAAR